MARRRLSSYEADAATYTRNPDVQTRTGTAYRSAKAEVEFWMCEYCVIRQKMIALGMDPKNPVYKELKDTDVFRHSSHHPVKLGEGGKAPGWIWTSKMGSTLVADKDLAEWSKEGKYIFSES